MTTLTMQWKYGQGGIRFINDGHIITFREATNNAAKGHYDEIIDEWDGPIPVNIWQEMKDKKSYLERKAAEA